MKLTSQAYEVNILFRAILVGQPRGLGYPPFSVYRVALNIKSILFTELFHLIPIDAILLDEPNEVFGIVFSVMGETNEEILFFKQLFQCLKTSSLIYFFYISFGHYTHFFLVFFNIEFSIREDFSRLMRNCGGVA